MTSRTTYRTRRLRAVLVVLVLAAVAVALGARLPATPTATSTASAPAPAPVAEPLAVDEAPVVVAPPVRGSDGLDAELAAAYERAAAAASAAGVDLRINSGRRTPEHQEELFRDAVARYGSEAAAARWVARADTSVHVSGDAIDVGPPAGATWLGAHGAAYGLCRIYANEPWHFELRTGGCPALYPDPTHDPRMQR